MSGGGKASTQTRPQFYGRRRGHRLRPARAALVANLLPRIRVPLPQQPGGLRPTALFSGDVEAVWLEIGFGAGEHIAHEAAAHSRIGLIGCEPYIDGVASLLSRIEAQSLRNVRIHDDDARHLLPALQAASLDRILLLFNDPWPKKRHHRRRFLQPETVNEMARLLRDDGEFLFASDHAEYTRWCLRHVVACGTFRWCARGAADWRSPPAGWAPTRYEAKARARGEKPYFLSFRRRPRRSERMPE